MNGDRVLSRLAKLAGVLLFTGWLCAVNWKQAAADLPSTGTVIRAVYDAVSGRNGKYRLDAINNYFVFGSSASPNGTAVVYSSGTLIVQSTTATSGHGLFKVFNYAASELLRVTQAGRFGLGTISPSALFHMSSGTLLVDGLLGNISVPGSSVTASAFFGDGSHLANITTPVTTVPTVQTLTSGSGATYTTPAGAKWLLVKMVGGGGGGGAGTVNNGSNGSTTIFNSVNANGGTGGAFGANTGSQAGQGGTGGTGTATFRAPGSPGGPMEFGAAAAYVAPGIGGSSCLGGGASAVGGTAAGINAAANSGGGGSGGNQSTSSAGGGGGGGECVWLLIGSPAASYTYTVGAGGNGGAAGSQAGGNGGSGVIVVEEHYNY